MYNPQGCQAAPRQGPKRGGHEEGGNDRGVGKGGKLAGNTLLPVDEEIM